MQVTRGRQSQHLLQRELPRGAGEEVPAAHHISDTCGGVIHHNGERVGDDAVASSHDEVTMARRIELDQAQAAIEAAHRGEGGQIDA